MQEHAAHAGVAGARARRRRCWSGSAPPTRSLPSSTNGAALALAAEARAPRATSSTIERERVVDLADVDVGGRDAGPLERELPERTAGDSVKSSHSLIVVCDVASPVPSTQTGGRLQVPGPLLGGEHDRAAAVASGCSSAAW